MHQVISSKAMTRPNGIIGRRRQSDSRPDPCPARHLGEAIRHDSFFSRLIAEARIHRPDTLPVWLYQAVQGAVTAMSHRRAATTIAGNLLAVALEIGRATPTTAVTLTTAARRALAASADPDEPPPDPPLAVCAKALMDVYTSQLPPDLALQVVVSLFSEHQQEDREAVVQGLLTS